MININSSVHIEFRDASLYHSIKIQIRFLNHQMRELVYKILGTNIVYSPFPLDTCWTYLSCDQQITYLPTEQKQMVFLLSRQKIKDFRRYPSYLKLTISKLFDINMPLIILSQVMLNQRLKSLHGQDWGPRSGQIQDKNIPLLFFGNK